MSVNKTRRIARRSEPMFNAPVVVIGLIAVLIGIYAAFDWSPVAVQDRIIRGYAFIPGRLTLAFWPDRLVDLLRRANSDPAAMQQLLKIRELQVLGAGTKPWTLLTYAFLHGSWTHVLLNMVWLIAFGPPIARRFGSAGFLLFMAATAIASALAHWLVTPMDFSPLVGASGADSGLMGAATRFMFQPGAPLGGFGFGGRPQVETIPAASLGQVFRERRSLIFILIWFGTNFIFGAGAQMLGFSDMPVAWVAHLGGFVAGLLLFPLFDQPFRAPPTTGELAFDPSRTEV
jgi:membrane associated rhomboid family serine protease